jgi:hypothetical protein
VNIKYFNVKGSVDRCPESVGRMRRPAGGLAARVPAVNRTEISLRSHRVKHPIATPFKICRSVAALCAPKRRGRAMTVSIGKRPRGRPRRDDRVDEQDLRVLETFRQVWRERQAAGQPWNMDAMGREVYARLYGHRAAGGSSSRRMFYRAVERLNAYIAGCSTEAAARSGRDTPDKGSYFLGLRPVVAGDRIFWHWQPFFGTRLSAKNVIEGGSPRLKEGAAHEPCSRRADQRLPPLAR